MPPHSPTEQLITQTTVVNIYIHLPDFDYMYAIVLYSHVFC